MDHMLQKLYSIQYIQYTASIRVAVVLCYESNHTENPHFLDANNGIHDSSELHIADAVSLCRRTGGTMIGSWFGSITLPHTATAT